MNAVRRLDSHPSESTPTRSAPTGAAASRALGNLPGAEGPRQAHDEQRPDPIDSAPAPPSRPEPAAPLPNFGAWLPGSDWDRQAQDIQTQTVDETRQTMHHNL